MHNAIRGKFAIYVCVNISNKFIVPHYVIAHRRKHTYTYRRKKKIQKSALINFHVQEK